MLMMNMMLIGPVDEDRLALLAMDSARLQALFLPLPTAPRRLGVWLMTLSFELVSVIDGIVMLSVSSVVVVMLSNCSD